MSTSDIVKLMASAEAVEPAASVFVSEPPAAAAVVAAPLSEEPPHAVRLAAIAAARIVNITFDFLIT